MQSKHVLLNILTDSSVFWYRIKTSSPEDQISSPEDQPVKCAEFSVKNKLA